MQIGGDRKGAQAAMRTNQDVQLMDAARLPAQCKYRPSASDQIFIDVSKYPQLGYPKLLTLSFVSNSYGQ